MDKILQYYPELTPTQTERFRLLDYLYREWNDKINVISRRDIDNLYVNHVLHSLSIAKFFTPVSGTTFMDLGTGGGFPGIPLAILWPDCNFHLIDRIGKKIKVASAIAEAVGLSNVTFQHGDSGECHQKFDYVVSRAVMALPDLIKACRSNISQVSRNRLPNGLICLKGGELGEELSQVNRPVVDVPLSDWYTEPYFETKELIYVNLQ